MHNVPRLHVNTTSSESSRCSSSCSEHGNPPRGFSSSASCPADLEREKPRSPQAEGRREAPGPQQLEELAVRVVTQALNRALYAMEGQNRANGSGGKKEEVREGKRRSGEEEKMEWFQKNGRAGSGGADQKDTLDNSDNGPGSDEFKDPDNGPGSDEFKDSDDGPGSDEFKDSDDGPGSDEFKDPDDGPGSDEFKDPDNGPGLDEFKDFLRGTPGERLLNLWMDIARLKAAQNWERKSRYLVLMRSRYLRSSSRSSLNVELLFRLGLTTSPCWTEEKLLSVQPSLTESLLHYWVPRFWTSRWVHEDRDDSLQPELWTEWCSRSQSDTQTPHRSKALWSDTWRPQHPHADHTQFHSSRSLLPGRRRTEKMLQALCVDSCAGLYFTTFCEQSGDPLWENAVNLWTDLQHYHELFYQGGLDPYRVQREAQLLYSTYLSGCARRSVGVGEEVRREVYDQLTPAFEELFDEVEELSLSILLEPWTLLLGRERESFRKVCVQEEVRCIDSQEYRELQSLYEESKRRLKRVEQCGSTPSSISPSSPFSKGRRAPGSWSRVSPVYQGYRLGSLLRHRHEIGHFMSFLQTLDASIHLTCWLDLEQYRRTPRKDEAARRDRSSHIATKYLSGKYFFGSDSPATAEQRNDILRLAGGLERLKLECLSNAVVGEIQDVVRSHIEKKWLPLFLSTAEFTERMRHEPKPQAADRLSQQRRRRARREAWKAGGLWMSSSKEILLFRRILLDPATCLRFRHFVSLKGDFLENNVLFWLEVQRYKDLCHSHSDEATVQQKISTIITCFIDSSVPPALQIDIPPQQAQQVLEKRHELGPYVFREAQMSVFSALLKMWPEFQELSSSVQEEQLLPLLQEKRVKHRARVRRERREEEEEEEERRRRAQEELERQESGLEEEDEDDEEEEQDGRSVQRAQSSVLLSPTQPLSWSYSKYMAALKREEVLLRRRSQLGASFSTASD
ncbi:regulator of G-protein signaling 22 [Pseudoliparis swirei]|uniref:regulator of G-protein signaling 22 n=1 Tax=Pseudoliparis swirei TaxID=2059687 RepID=UPI0024BD987F|nr:regulator of G-protein signaling 22 [Pseudoliparis swirei]